MSTLGTVIELRSHCLDHVEALTGEQPVEPVAKLAHDLAVRLIRATTRPADLEQLRDDLRALRLDSAEAGGVTPAPAVGGIVSSSIG